ncbi:hypothetical protein ACFL6P_08105 [Candidatus Latescibacterota bacterium]
MRTLKFMQWKWLLIIFVALNLNSELHAITMEELRISGEFYYGHGISENAREASDMALNDLTNQISVTITSDFQNKVTQTNSDLETRTQSIIKTFSRTTLRNVETIRTMTDDGISIIHYIKKDDVNKIFDERCKLISDIYFKANDMEQSGDIGYALKWYYFAAVLMNSLPAEYVERDGVNFTTDIPENINKIIQGIGYSFLSEETPSKEEKIVNIAVTYDEKPVKYVALTFWDGSNQVDVDCRNGKASICLYGSAVNFDKLDIQVKYSFYESRDEFKSVAELWELVQKPIFRNRISIPIKINESITLGAESIEEKPLDKEIVSIPENISSQAVEEFEETDTVFTLVAQKKCPVQDEITRETNDFLNALKSGESEELNAQYVEDSFLCEKLARIVEYNSPVLTESNIEANLIETSDGWEVRHIEVVNRYPTVAKQSVDYIVMDYNKEGVLTDINYGITESLYDEFVVQASYGNDWGNRQIIIKFVEKYRTAYLNRDISTIESIFSDDAVIIVGRIRTTKNERMKDVRYNPISDGQPDVDYLRFTKQEYLERQKRLFQTNEHIFLGFSSFRITRKNNNPGVYGVEMRQFYNSSIYSDEGHLFLLIDFNETLPQIYVRAWQPQEWDESMLVTASNFFVHR